MSQVLAAAARVACPVAALVIGVATEGDFTKSVKSLARAGRSPGVVIDSKSCVCPVPASSSAEVLDRRSPIDDAGCMIPALRR
jgi:hypothetical protein